MPNDINDYITEYNVIKSSDNITFNIEKFLMWLEVESGKSYIHGKLIAIEGTQIISLNHSYLQNKPLIITGLSLIKSYIRKAKRDMTPNLDLDHIKVQLNAPSIHEL